MAEKRMFSKGIIDSDHFLNMSATSRLLYYDLGMRADDDGFLNDAKKIIRMTGSSEGDLKSLIENEFVISFRSGIIVITHWKVNNYLRGDRYKVTRFLEEKSQLQLSENGQYIINGNNILGIPTSNQITTNGLPMVDEWCTQSSIDKSSIDKSSIDKSSVDVKKEKEKKSIYGEYKNVKLTDTEYQSLLNDYGIDTLNILIKKVDEGVESKGYKYKNFKITIKNWAERDNIKKKIDKTKVKTEPKKVEVKVYDSYDDMLKDTAK